MEFITQLAIALLSGYLSLTNIAAHGIERGLDAFGLVTAPQVRELSTSPRTLPSRFKTRTPAARILLENLRYQQAAVAGAGTASEGTVGPASLEDALVNILCSYTNGHEVRTITGSGSFIDPKGIILTNAHVAQFLLLRGALDEAECVVRQGSPATARYTADVLYISPLWINEHAAQIDEESPEGTGERDYALLYVTGAVDGTLLPDSFPALTVRTTPLHEGDSTLPVTVAGYPADNFATEGPDVPMEQKIDETTLTELYTFGSGSVDLVSIGASSVGEHGASGGPISSDGEVIGLIVTRGSAAHSLRALTIAYISTTMKEETGFDLRATLGGNVTQRANAFREALAPLLTDILVNEL